MRNIGFLLFPGITQLDLTGPYEVLGGLPDVRVHLVARDRAPVASKLGLAIVPTATLADSPRLDVLCVPGGHGINGLLADDLVLDWVATQGARAELVTSVCTGALVLGAAGLLDGYQATTHWLWLDFLPMFHATPVAQRVVVDRNRITAAGVTAGIEFGLLLAASLAGEPFARGLALGLEYDPSPPFPGSPRTAPKPLVSHLEQGAQSEREERRRLCEACVARRHGAAPRSVIP